MDQTAVGAIIVAIILKHYPEAQAISGILV
ncbi:MAG: hypothetical protein BWY25_01248 [Chloroflexi bacterium ADurb.Bin222]|nr:MAG: hypothetical protein BWY25_01248 [Chloroflexi bacterium ADurb.Bin222]